MANLPVPLVALVSPLDWTLLQETPGVSGRGVINITASGTTQLPVPVETDTSVYVSVGLGTVTIQMPAGGALTAGYRWLIIDTGGFGAAHNITIQPATGDTYLIAGSTSFTINSNYGAVQLEWDGAAMVLVV